jgi:ligand-binding sensor domain-containing protein/signal transduction histidine kinase
MSHRPTGCCRALHVLLAITTALLAACNLTSAEALNDTAPASAFVARWWQVEDGLPHSSVNTILQTRDGYLWVGTSDGLARFDGHRFTVFGLADGLPSLRILSLLEDRTGALWIGTSVGICRLREGAFETWEWGRQGDNEITTIAEDRSGNIWIGSVNGLSRWRDGNFTILGKAEGLEDKRVRAIVSDGNDGVWVSMFYQGLLHWDGTRFAPLAAEPEKLLGPPISLLLDRQGTLWTGHRGIVSCLRNGKWRQYGRSEGLPPNRVGQMVEADDGSVWAAVGNGGLYLLTAGSNAPLWLNSGLDSGVLLSVATDREQNVWVGTRARGLARLKPKKFTVLPVQTDSGPALPRTLAETPDGTLWAGTTSKGLFRIRDGQVDPFLRQPPVSGFPFVSAVLSTRDGSLWWGAGPALFQWNNSQLAASYDQEFRSWLREDRIRVLCEDREDGLWIGTQNGQLRLLRQGQFLAYTNAEPKAPITALLQKRDGTLLVGTHGKGVMRVRIGNTLASIPACPARFITTLHSDEEDVLWVGTEGEGLVRMQGDRVTAITTQHGLINDTIVQILEDKRGYLWLGSYRGIFRLSKQELEKFCSEKTTLVHPLLLDRSDDMPSEQCMRGFNAGLKTRDKLLHFSTDKGIVTVNPADQAGGGLPPIVRIEKMLVDGALRYSLGPAGHAGFAGLAGGHQTHATKNKQGLVLAPGTRRLEFHYTGLKLATPENIRFRYQLAGFDNGWVEAGRDRVALYAQLPADQYQFRVTACDESGNWNEHFDSLSFQVLPFFWQTWWFRLGVLFAIVSGVVAVVRYVSFRQLRRRLQLLEQEAAVQQDRARIAKDLHDDLGAHLSQIAMLSELAQADLEKPEQARGHIDQIFRTARAVTRGLDEIVWAVNPRNDTLDRFAAHLCTFAPEYLRTAEIRCRLDLPMEIPSTPLPANVRHHLYLAFKEALHNVVKHSGASEVWLRLNVSPHDITLTIEDNGRGFEAEGGPAEGEDGLANLRQRMLDVGGRFEQQSQPGKGTRTILSAPIANGLLQN